jgi:hypothetical protein
LAEKLYVIQQTVAKQSAKIEIKNEYVSTNLELHEHLVQLAKELADKHHKETENLLDTQSSGKTHIIGNA